MKNPTQTLITRASLLTTAFHNTRWIAGIVAGSALLGSTAMSADWLGTTSSDWNDPANWNPAGVPAATAAVINTISPNFPVLTSNAISDPQTVGIGVGAGTSGRVDIRNGRIITGAAVTVGDDGGSGILNIADTAVSDTTVGKFTPYGVSGVGPKLQVTGQLRVGGIGVPTGPATGVMNVNTTGTISTTGNLIIGEGNTTGGTVNIDSGTVGVGGEMWIGNAAGGVGRLNMSNGTINVNSNWFAMGRNGATGFLTMTGGAINKAGTGDFIVGTDPGGNGTIELRGGTITVTSGVVGIGDRNNTGTAPGTPGTALGTLRFPAGSTALFTANGGNMIIGRNRTSGANVGGTGLLEMQSATATLTVPGTRQLFVANGAASRGTFNLSQGTVNVNDWFVIGREGATGEMNMTGGTINKTGGGSFALGALLTGANGTLNLSGGLINLQTGTFFLAEAGTNPVGTLNLSGSGEIRVGTFTAGNAGTGTGNANLDGGTLRVQNFNGGAGTAHVDFNGTQIIATGNNANFISNFDTADVEAGGLLVNTNGFALTSSQPLANAGGGVVKTGAGSLTLTGANTYTGATSVQAGTLNVTTASTGGGAFTMSGGTTLGVTQAVDTGVLNVSTLTMDTGSVLNLSFADAPGNPAAAPVNAGTLALTGTVTINVTDPDPALGTLRLVSYAGGSAANFVLGKLPEGVVASLVNSGGVVSLDITRINAPHWVGDGNSLNPGVWDTTTANWEDFYTDNLTTFANGDPAIFEDFFESPTDFNVTLDITVTPGSTGVTFDNVNDFTLTSPTGLGKISGTKGLTKKSVGTLTIGNLLNDFTGPTVLEGGVTSVGLLANTGSPSPLGAGNLVLAGGTLAYTGAADVIETGFSTAAGGSVSGLNLTNSLEFQGAITSTGGGLVKSGPGNLTLSFNGANVVGGAGQASEVQSANLFLTGGGSQTFSFPGSLYVGTVQNLDANIVLSNTAVTVGSFFVVGRGNGDDGDSSLTATNSTLTTGGFSTGFAAGAPSNLSEQTVTLTNSTVTSSGNAYVAESAGATAVMTLGGTSQLNSANQLVLAREANTTATVTLNGSSQINKSTTTGHVSIGGGGTGTLIMNQNSLFTSTVDFNVGDTGTGLGLLDINDDATVTSAGPVFIGKNSTKGTVSMSGTSEMTSGNTNVGGGAATSEGTLTLTDTASYVSNGRLQVGPGALSKGTVTIGGSASVQVNSYVSVGFNGEGIMTVQGDGSFTNNDDFSVNENGDDPAIVTVQDTGSISMSGNLFIGRAGTRVGTLNVLGASTFDQTGATTQSFFVGLDGTGTLNLAGTAVVTAASANGVVIGNSGSGTGTVNLDGGTLIGKRVFGGAGNSTFNFNGGLLRAAAGATPAFMAGVDNAFVKTGGAFIDSNGQDIAINVPLLEGTPGAGGLTKSGSGTLRLSGVNTYTGTTTVSGGNLGGTATIAGPLVVQTGAGIAPGAVTGTLTANGGVTFQSGTNFVVNIDDSQAADNGLLATTGNLNVTNVALQLNVTGVAGAAPYTIATAGSVTGPFASVPPGVTVSYNPTSITITPPAGSSYDAWISGFDVDGMTAKTDDFDGDGLTNLEEFALDGNPASGVNTGKVRSRIETVGGEQALVITLPVRVGATFDNNPGPGADATVVADDVSYLIRGSNDLQNFDQGVTEIAPSTSNPAMPALSDNTKWTYRSFRLNGAIPARGAKGFLDIEIEDAP